MMKLASELADGEKSGKDVGWFYIEDVEAELNAVIESAHHNADEASLDNTIHSDAEVFQQIKERIDKKS